MPIKDFPVAGEGLPWTFEQMMDDAFRVMHGIGRRTILAGGVLLSLGGLRPAMAQALAEVDAAALERLRAEGVAVIDIRTPAEWRETGTIEGSARVMAFGTDGRIDPAFMERFTELVPDKDRPFVLVCRSSARTRVIGRALAGSGYSRAMHLGGGILGWQASGRAMAPCPGC